MKRIRENNDDFAGIQAMIQPLLDERLAEIERLNAQPHEYSEESMERIQKILGNPKKHSRTRTIFSMSRRVASVALVTGTVLLTAVLCIQPIRAAIWNFFLEWHEEYYTVQVSEECQQECPQMLEQHIIPDNLPEGWTLQTESETLFTGVYQIFGTNEERIFYHLCVVGGSTSYDSTDVVKEKIRLNDRTEAYQMTYVEGDILISWVDKYQFTLSGHNISAEQLLEIAENIDSQNH